MSKIETVIFDMDGTIYQIDGSSAGYIGSSLEMKVLTNATKLIIHREPCNEVSAAKILKQGLDDEIGLSNFLSTRYGMSREDYFEYAWNIDPEGIVKNYQVAVEVIRHLASQDLRLILLTSAPAIWQRIVFEYIGLSGYFSETITGEDFKTKPDIFNKIASTTSPETVLSVGDQQHTDITPALAVGFHALLIQSPNDLNKITDYLKNQ